MANVSSSAGYGQAGMATLLGVELELNLLSRVAYRGQEVAGPRLRGLLALLAADLRTGCGTPNLIEGLWPDDQPEKPAKALQVLVSRARSQLGADLIASTPTGYRLTLAEAQVDASAVLLHAASAGRHARAGDHAAALAEAEQGLALWESVPEGDELHDDPGRLDDPVSALRAERRSTYRSLVRLRALSLARLGRYGEATAPLTTLAAQRSHDEEVLAELLRGEAATAGPAAALSRYEAYRHSLRDELGTDPGPALQAIHKQLLQDAAPTVRHGIPYEPNPLLGRDDDLVAVADLLHSSRVVSIVGPGGLGKTRLAYAVARQAEQRVVHGVPLAGVAADADVAAEVAASLEAGEHGGARGRGAEPSDPLATIAAALGSAPALLVLDNCEHVLGGVAELVRAVVAMTKDVRVLTTGRAPLGLSSESVYPLPELPLPVSIALFEQRARAARPGVELPAGPVAEVCQRLDGLPLAVELAAARARVMSVTELAGRLADRFSLLRGGTRDVPERQQTLQAVVDWSWNLLDPAGQAAMRALSVFPGGFTVDAAAHLVGDDQALPVLEHLTDQSLLKVVETRTGTRYRVLETIREFGAARRDAAGETERVLDGFLGWAREFGKAHHELLLGAEPFLTAGRVRAEQDNLGTALRYGLAREDAATVAASAAVLAGLWTFEARYARMVALADEIGWLLSHFRPGPDLVGVTRTAVTLCIGNTFMLASPRADRLLATLRRLPPGDPGTMAGALAIVLAAVPEIRGPDSPVLRRLCESDRRLVAGLANAVASYVFEQAGELERALAAARGMVGAVTDQAVPWLQGLAHTRAGELCLRLERAGPAREHVSAALGLIDAHGPWLDVLQLRWTMVLVELQLGAVDEAERWLELAGNDWLDERYGMRAFDLGARAGIRLLRGDVAGGLRQWRRAVTVQRESPDPLFQIEPLGLEPWALEVEAACVVAHAQHGRLDLVPELVAELPRTLSRMLTTPMAKAPPYVMEFPLLGTLLLAQAMVELDRGAGGAGARLIALAERLRYLRGFQPTMSSARARAAAGRADRAAYADAVSAYAALSDEDLRAAALAALPS